MSRSPSRQRINSPARVGTNTMTQQSSQFHQSTSSPSFNWGNVPSEGRRSESPLINLYSSSPPPVRQSNNASSGLSWLGQESLPQNVSGRQSGSPTIGSMSKSMSGEEGPFFRVPSEGSGGAQLNGSRSIPTWMTPPGQGEHISRLPSNTSSSFSLLPAQGSRSRSPARVSSPSSRSTSPVPIKINRFQAPDRPQYLVEGEVSPLPTMQAGKRSNVPVVTTPVQPVGPSSQQVSSPPKHVTFSPNIPSSNIKTPTYPFLLPAMVSPISAVSPSSINSPRQVMTSSSRSKQEMTDLIRSIVISPVSPLASGVKITNVVPGKMTTGTGSIEQMKKDISEMKVVVAPYFKELLTNKCSNLEGLDFVRVKLQEFLKIYNDYAPLASRVRSPQDLELAIEVLDDYIKSINKILDAMLFCHKRFIKDYVAASLELEKMKKSPSSNTEYIRLMEIDIRKSYSSLEQISRGSNAIIAVRNRMDDELKSLKLRHSSTEPMIQKQASVIPSSVRISPVVRTMSYLVGSDDTDFLYKITRNNEPLRKSVLKLTNERDGKGLKRLVAALKIKEISDELTKMGYEKESISVMKYSTDDRGVEAARQLYNDIREREMLIEELRKRGVQPFTLQGMNNNSLRMNLQKYHQQERSEQEHREFNTRDDARQKHLMSIQSLSTERELDKLNDTELYNLTRATVGVSAADNAFRHSDRRRRMISMIASSEMGYSR